MTADLPVDSAPHGGRHTDWMAEGKFGVMMTYLAEGLPPGLEGLPPEHPVQGSYVTGQWPSVDEWNERVNAFDVPALVRQLTAVGAGWFQFSVGQISGYWAAPNLVYEKLVPATAEHPSRLSKRDLVKEIGTALQGTGIRFLVYLPADTPRYDTYAAERLGGEIQDRAFQDNWVAVMKQYSQQWGTLVDGWWIDGVYAGVDAYYSELIDALRSGNPKALVSLSALDWLGPDVAPTATAKTDFLGGEVGPNWEPEGRFLEPNFGGVAQLQQHAFPMAQTFWGAEPDFPLTYPPEEMAARSARVASVGAAVTWDVGYVRETGLISDPSMTGLYAIGAELGKLPSDKTPRSNDRNIPA